MVRVVGVRFKKAGKIYYFDPAELPAVVGCKVIVETARGIEYGDVAVGPKFVDESQVVQPLKRVIRIGTEKDATQVAENKRKEKEAFACAVKKIESHGLDMNLVDVEYTFDGSKIIFYFTAEGRVDFRELVKDLASVFRTRIEMRQIGVRDEAKLIGGLGPCGRILCCTSFLGEFAPVSIRMAKDQNLSLNPGKISGVCGRLMCCLRYEQDTYEAAKKDPTLAPGYVPPILLESAPEALSDLEDEAPRESWKAGVLKVGHDGELGGRLGRVVAGQNAEARGAGAPAPGRSPVQPGAVPGRAPQGQRPERPGRSERSDRPDRGERVSRTDRGRSQGAQPPVPGPSKSDRSQPQGKPPQGSPRAERPQPQSRPQVQGAAPQPTRANLQVMPGGKGAQQPARRERGEQPAPKPQQGKTQQGKPQAPPNQPRSERSTQREPQRSPRQRERAPRTESQGSSPRPPNNPTPPQT